MSLFDLASKEKEVARLDQLSLEEGFWSDQKKAQHTIRNRNALKDIIDSFELLHEELVGLNESADVLKEDFDQELMELTEEEYKEIETKFDDFEMKVLLSHEYDNSNAILEIHPGAGGTESCDWASMLYRCLLYTSPSPRD